MGHSLNKIITVCIFLLFGSILAQAQIVWSGSVSPFGKTFGNFHPRVVVDRTGNPMIIWGRNSDASVLFSRWGGSAFAPPVKLNPEGISIATQGWMGPDIASKGDTLYVVMKKIPESDAANRILLVRSTDGGISFSSAKEIGFINDSISRFPTINVDSQGNPIVAFMKFNCTFGDSRWAVMKSTDMGNTFSVDIKASGQAGGAICDCCPGSVTSSFDKVAMLYRTNISNIRDSWIGLSTDNAISFPVGYNVDNNNWEINSCPATGPDGVIIGDTLYSVFMNAASGKSKTYLSKFDINGTTANSVIALTPSVSGVSIQNYPRVDAYGSALAIVWKQTVNGTDQLPLLFTNDVSKGIQTSVSELVDASDITNADVALSEGNIYVVWEDDASGTIKYRAGKYTTITASVIDDSLLPSISPNPATNFIEISVGANGRSPLQSTVKIYNVYGQIVSTFNPTPTLPASREGVSMDVSGLAPGMYFVRIGDRVGKFVKL